MAGQLTTHVLDTVSGLGAAGLRVQLRRPEPAAELADIVLDARGRGVLFEALEPGVYELIFHAAAYHRAQGLALSDPPFLDEVAVRFGVAEGAGHWHVPLLLSPFSYSTYRGG